MPGLSDVQLSCLERLLREALQPRPSSASSTQGIQTSSPSEEQLAPEASAEPGAPFSAEPPKAEAKPQEEPAKQVQLSTASTAEAACGGTAKLAASETNANSGQKTQIEYAQPQPEPAQAIPTRHPNQDGQRLAPPCAVPLEEQAIGLQHQGPHDEWRCQDSWGNQHDQRNSGPCAAPLEEQAIGLQHQGPLGEWGWQDGWGNQHDQRNSGPCAAPLEEQAIGLQHQGPLGEWGWQDGWGNQHDQRHAESCAVPLEEQAIGLQHQGPLGEWGWQDGWGNQHDQRHAESCAVPLEEQAIGLQHQGPHDQWCCQDGWDSRHDEGKLHKQEDAAMGKRRWSRWEPDPSRPRELQLRKMQDAKNLREIKRKIKKGLYDKPKAT